MQEPVHVTVQVASVGLTVKVSAQQSMLTDALGLYAKLLIIAQYLQLTVKQWEFTCVCMYIYCTLTNAQLCGPDCGSECTVVGFSTHAG